jgi:uncharacterized protein YheU (UPF0270 family)
MHESKEDLQPPVEVPLDLLSNEALEGIIESFILREGTDYGQNEALHSTKVEQIRKQVARGDIKIVFDPNTESVGLMTKNEFARAVSK